MPARAQILAAISVVVSLMLTRQLSAAPFCVKTPQQLRDAFVSAENSSESDTIMIAAGLYATAGSPFSYDSSLASLEGDLLLVGGYNDDCSLQYPIPTLTVLDGGGGSSVLAAKSNHGSITVQHLTVQHAAGSNGFVVSTNSGDANVEYNIVRSNHAQNALAVVSAGTIRVDNNLIVNNTVGSYVGSLAILISGTNPTYITGNTIAGNAGISPQPYGGILAAYFFSSGTPVIYVSNNILWGNSGYDYYAASSAGDHSSLINNDIGNSNVLASCCSSNVEPQFVATDNFHLASTSPLLGAGTVTPPGGLSAVDLDGNPRFFNGLTDIGAYERGDEIFKNGFN